jgi:hypothetical protein
VMFAAGVAVLWWMAALTALMVYEKVGRHGAAVGQVAGVALLATAALQIAHPVWLPAALGGSRSFTSDVNVGTGSVSRVVRMNGYSLELALGAQRATRPGFIRLKLSRGTEAVNGAQVRARYTMLDMAMPDVESELRHTGPGMYGTSAPVLGMAGRWGIRFDIAPPHDSPFTVRVVDRVAP